MKRHVTMAFNDNGSCDHLVRMFTCLKRFFNVDFFLLTGPEVHLNASTEAYTRVSHHSSDDQSSHSPEVHGEESEKPYDYSGHIPPAEVAVVSEELGSSMGTPVVDGDGVTLLTQTFVSESPLTPSLEELSSSEIITLVPDGVASPEAVTQEDPQEADSIPTTTHSDINKRERDAGEGSGGSSGESEEEATSRILSAEYHPEDQDVTTTLIPHQTLTGDWEPESSFPSSSTSSSSFPSASLLSSPYTPSPSSAWGGSQPNEEFSAEPPSTEGSDRISKERHADITTRSIRSCELGRNVRKLFHLFQFDFNSPNIFFNNLKKKP